MLCLMKITSFHFYEAVYWTWSNCWITTHFMTINPTLRAHMQMLQVEGRRNDIHKLTVLRSRFTRIFCDKICVPHTFYDFKTRANGITHASCRRNQRMLLWWKPQASTVLRSCLITYREGGWDRWEVMVTECLNEVRFCLDGSSASQRTEKTVFGA